MWHFWNLVFSASESEFKIGGTYLGEKSTFLKSFLQEKLTEFLGIPDRDSIYTDNPYGGRVLDTP